MRGQRIVAVALAALVAACADTDTDTDVEGVEEGAPSAAELADRENTWDVRLDRAEADQGGFQLVETGEGLDLRTGPAGIFYRPTNLVETGDYTLSATFAERSEEEGHREAYGLFIGGRDLQSPTIQYTYFLVRGTGEYLIKRREGDETTTLVDWTSSPAVNEAGEGEVAPVGPDTAAAGTPVTNQLTVRVRGDTVHFLVNGTEVETVPATEARPWGVVGMRANHRLDLSIRDWGLEISGSEGQDELRTPGNGDDTAATGG